MKEDKILIIDLKERLCKGSVILKIDESESSDITLDFNLGKDNQKALQCIKNKGIDESLSILKHNENMVKQQFVKSTYPEEVRKHLILSRVAKAAEHAGQAINGRESIDNFLQCKDALKKLSSVYVNNIYNEMPELTEVYEFFISKMNERINSYNSEELTKELKANLNLEDKMQQYIKISSNLKRVIGSTEEGKALLLHIEEINGGLLEKFNSSIDKRNMLKKIFGQDYKELLNCDEVNKHLEILNSKYEGYEQIKEDMEIINNIYLMNTAKNFDDYYNSLLSLSITKLINITSYLREYIAITMFNDKTNYYCVKKIEQRINDIINEVNISNYPTMIPI